MTKAHQIEELINAYMEKALEIIERMRSEFSSQNLLRAWREKRIPISGKLANGEEYMFHGIGCRVDCDGVQIDFDLDGNGELIGFDAWRLFTFASSFPFIYADLQKHSLVQQEMERLLHQGFIVKSDFYGSYYKPSKAPNSKGRLKV